MTTPPFETPSARDIAILSAQLGRPVRSVIGVAPRCVCGAPTVVATNPRLDDGTPFPTLYYLSHPAATSAVSTLEATGVMAELSGLLIDEGGAATELGAACRAAHDSYLADRESIVVVDEITGYSAGGMPDRIKCLHALVAHALAAGPGVNPIGDLALARAEWTPDRCECAQPGPGAPE